MTIMIWLIIMIVCLLIEAVTVGLATIWFAAGALAAIIVCALGMGALGQWLVFFAVSMVLLIFTRPLAVKYINAKKVTTNYEDAIGRTVQITEQVDNIKGTGTAVLNGQEWTARSWQENKVLEKDTLAKVLEVTGVRLIVAPVEQDAGE